VHSGLPEGETLIATFSNWWVAIQKKPEPRQITWLCGTERVLIDEVVDNIKNYLNPAPWNLTKHVVGEVPERQIWSDVNLYPSDAEPRLVIVRDAEKLKQKDRLIDFVTERTRNPLTYLIFVSNESSLPRKAPTQEQKNKRSKGDFEDYIDVLKGKGYAIECKPFTATTAKHAVMWVQSKAPMRDGIAGHLLNRSNGNLRLVRDVCEKLAVFPDDISLTTVNGMLTERPRDSFAEALLAMDKKTALLALREIQPGEYGRLIGLLDAQLDLAGMIHDMQLEHKTPSEMARAAGNRNFLVPDLIPVAKHYDPKRRLTIRRTLAMLDEAYRAGNRIGLMESLVVLW
jgi:DNA polymerase III delta subunit